jgi:mannose-6-phosphate isomerase-like protein (cupin superfamily)
MLRRTEEPPMRMARLGFEASFKVAFTAGHAQAAEMTLRPGGKEGGPDNRHQGADQWLYVVYGRGEATVGDREVPLQAGTLLVIERGEAHQIRNTGDQPLQTLNFYHPPAYDAEGEPLPAGEG